MEHKDKYGDVIKFGDTVDVDAPTSSLDLHNNAFTGTVVSIDGDYVGVKDQDDNYYDLESEILETFPLDF